MDTVYPFTHKIILNHILNINENVISFIFVHKTFDLKLLEYAVQSYIYKKIII